MSAISIAPLEKRAMSNVNAPLAGSTLEDYVMLALTRVSPVRREATVLPTDHGEIIEVPVVNDQEDAEVHGENQTAVSPDIVIGSEPLGAFNYDSGQLRLSKELWDDGGPQVRRMIGRALAGRIGRTSNRHFTVGTGIAQPRGVVAASALGETAGDSSVITYNELLNLLHSVADRHQDAALFMMNLTTLRQVRTLADPNGHPVYKKGLLLDKMVVINAAMPDIAANAKPIVYGDLSMYHIREIGDVDVRHSRERYAEFGQVGVAAVLRADGNLIDENAVKHLLMAN